MDYCPVCNSDNGIKLDIVTGYTEKMWKAKNDICWNVEIYLCLDCDNIYGERR